MSQIFKGMKVFTFNTHRWLLTLFQMPGGCDHRHLRVHATHAHPPMCHLLHFLSFKLQTGNLLWLLFFPHPPFNYLPSLVSFSSFLRLLSCLQASGRLSFVDDFLTDWSLCLQSSIFWTVLHAATRIVFLKCKPDYASISSVIPFCIWNKSQTFWCRYKPFLIYNPSTPIFLTLLQLPSLSSILNHCNSQKSCTLCRCVHPRFSAWNIILKST